MSGDHPMDYCTDFRGDIEMVERNCLCCAFVLGAAAYAGLMAMAEAIAVREAEKHWTAADARSAELEAKMDEALRYERTYRRPGPGRF